MEEKLGIIGGSQADLYLSKGALSTERLGKRSTPFGLSENVFRVEGIGEPFYFLARHGEQESVTAASFVNYRANIYALKELGVEEIVAWSGTVAVDTKYRRGQYIVPDDIVDETRSRPSTFFREGTVGFLPIGEPFCPTLRASLVKLLEELGHDIGDQGTYVCIEGPRTETAAEVRKYWTFGGDILGMTLVPEAFLARELEMHYAALCWVMHYAAGVMEENGEPAAASEQGPAVTRTIEDIAEIVMWLGPELAKVKGKCRCHQFLEPFREAGTIDPDWKNWVQG